MSTAVLEPKYRTTVMELREFDRMESDLPQMVSGKLEELRRQDYGKWCEVVCWLRNDDAFREKRLAHEEALEDDARAARIAAKKKPAPAAAVQPVHYLTVKHLPTISKWLARTWGPQIGKQVSQQIDAASGRFADPERVAELQNRCAELESRLASFEKRTAAHDSAISAHRKHLSNLEIKTNDMRRAMEGQPPSGARREP